MKYRTEIGKTLRIVCMGCGEKLVTTSHVYQDHDCPYVPVTPPSPFEWVENEIEIIPMDDHPSFHPVYPYKLEPKENDNEAK